MEMFKQQAQNFSEDLTSALQVAQRDVGPGNHTSGIRDAACGS
jgi:hypothetical protein